MFITALHWFSVWPPSGSQTLGEIVALSCRAEFGAFGSSVPWPVQASVTGSSGPRKVV
jgi:hypothetical protein